MARVVALTLTNLIAVATALQSPLQVYSRRPPGVHPVRRRAPAPAARTITDEARDTIWELVQLDFELVSEQMVQRRNPEAAWALAQASLEKRRPIIEWTLRYNVDRASLNLVEQATNCSLVKWLSPKGHAELHWQRSHLIKRLVEQRSRLAMALIALRPALRQRLLEAVTERPSLMAPISQRSLKSSLYYVQWVGNQWFKKLRTAESFEATRAALIEKWLQALLEVHDRIKPSRLSPSQQFDASATFIAVTAADVLKQWIERTQAELTTTIYVDEEWPGSGAALTTTPRAPPAGPARIRLLRSWPSLMRGPSWRPPSAIIANKLQEQWRARRADTYLLLSRLALWPMRRMRPVLLAVILAAAHTSALTQRLGWQTRSALRRSVSPRGEQTSRSWRRLV